MTKRIVIAIDGPAGVGKTTAARLVAERLGFKLIDTGAIYRALALLARERGISWDEEEPLATLAAQIRLDFSGPASSQKVLLEGRDVSREIRTPEISEGASRVSRHPGVRQALLELQRRLAGQGGAVMEGRDIGTVVWPQAEVKVFLTAEEEVRARRRFQELREKNLPVDFNETLEQMRRRDERDSKREAAPLKPASDAVIIDSGEMTAEQVVEQIIKLAAKKLK